MSINPTGPAVDWAAYADHAAAAIGLPLAPEHREGVIANLARIAQVAAAVNSIPLTDTDEVAEVFRP
jgi:hypothetical protein